ncbi:MAG: TRAP transporter TatT component family protein [Bacteroidota bacterium]
MKMLTAVLLGAFLFPGCVQSIAVNAVGGIVDDGFEAVTEEEDLALAAAALPANLKLLEVMLKNEPENTRLLLLLSEGYCSYALGFVEDEEPERARLLYGRGRDYGLRALRQDPSWAAALDGNLPELEAHLVRAEKEMVPAAFWSGFGWGGLIMLSLSDPDAVADIPKAEALMRFVAREDSSFYHGGAHVFLGTLAGSRPRILGGNPERSREHFETALRMAGGMFLMTYVYYARSYAVQTLNEALFEELLGRVREAPAEAPRGIRLANAIARKKAELLLGRKAELF